MMYFAQRILNLAYLITTGCQSEKLCLMIRRNTQITPSLWHFLYYESFSIWVSELRVKVVTDGIAIDSRGKFYFTVVHLSILCAQGVTVTSQGWYMLTLCSRHLVWHGMQDGGVVTVTMISRNACKISIKKIQRKQKEASLKYEKQLSVCNHYTPNSKFVWIFPFVSFVLTSFGITTTIKKF